VNKQAPFPDDNSLAQFTSGFNATTLLQNSGLGSSSTTSPAALPKTKEVLTDSAGNPWPMIFGFLNAGSLVMTALIEPIVDVQIPKGVDTSKWGSWTNWDPLTLASVLRDRADGVIYSVAQRINVLGF
jgi:hypothetical protein